MVAGSGAVKLKCFTFTLKCKLVDVAVCVEELRAASDSSLQVSARVSAVLPCEYAGDEGAVFLDLSFTTVEKLPFNILFF